MISRAQIAKTVEIYREQNANRAEKWLDGTMECARLDECLPLNKKYLDQVRNIVRETPDVRTDRIQECQDKVTQGKYVVDSNEVADKLLGRLFADRLR